MRSPSVFASLIAAAVALAMGAAILPKPLGTAPVVVELFTSQGCSSCPPADEWIRAVARDSELKGKVIPLAFHVDYWNRLGWRDPFSSAEWSRRQMFYVRALSLQSAYTPQAVVNGSRQFVGSNSVALAGALADASHRTPVGRVSVDARRNGDNVTAIVHADAPRGFDVMLVLFQNDVTTSIAAGENAGRTQTEDAIVRRLQRVNSDATVTLPIDPSWKHLGVAVLLQNHDTLAIGNVAVTSEM
jgi:hypothetical protein